MRFANISAAYIIWFIILLAGFYLWSFNRRKQLLEKFASKDLISELAGSLNIKARKLKTIFILIGLLSAAVSLMRPQWGFEWEEVKRKGLDIIIAIDTSKSMLAEDVKPNRLERSKLAVKDLLKKLNGDRIGLIAFSGSAFLQCPLTVDYNGFMLSLDSLDTDIIPRGGTSISSAIRETVKAYGKAKREYKAVVLITDGEDNEGGALKEAKAAAKEGVQIFCIGIGTKEGELISIVSEDGQKTYLKDKEGNFVKSRLDESLLKDIALSTNGSYIKASGAEFGLDWIYGNKLSKMEKQEFGAKMHKRYEERFQWTLLLSFLLLLAEPFISERKKIEKLMPGRLAARQLKGMSFFLIWFMFLTIFSFITPICYCEEQHQKKQTKVMNKEPATDIGFYNNGVKNYKDSGFDEAIESFTKALTTENSKLEGYAYYNIGNSKYRLGQKRQSADPASAVKFYDEALEYYRKALQVDENDKDAKFNYEFVNQELKLLKQYLKEHPEKQSEQNQKKENENNKKPAEQQAEKKREDKEKSKQQDTEKREEQQEGAKESPQSSGKGEEQRQEQKQGSDNGHEKMSEEEAYILLEDCKDDEVKGTLNREKKAYFGEVLKDW